MRETPMPAQTDFSDYRTLGGGKVPFTTRVPLVDPWVGSTRKAEELQVGVVVDPGRFAMPR